MKRSIVLPGLALAGGAAGFWLRRLQLAQVYDPETMLFRSGSPITYGLLGLLAVLALVFLLSTRGGRKPGDFLPAFRCAAPLYMTLMAVSAFLFLGAGVLGLLEGMEEIAIWRMGYGQATYPISLTLCAALCFPAGMASLLMGRAAYRGKLTSSVGLLICFPSFVGLVRLFASHLSNGTDPVLMGYVFSLGAVALLMLAQYYTAGFLFGRCCPKRMMLCALMGIPLGLVSLADGLSRFAAVLTLAFVVSALALSSALLENCFGPEPSSPEAEGESAPVNDLDEGV